MGGDSGLGKCQKINVWSWARFGFDLCWWQSFISWILVFGLDFAFLDIKGKAMCLFILLYQIASQDQDLGFHFAYCSLGPPSDHPRAIHS
jgi:hypothetical protein